MTILKNDKTKFLEAYNAYADAIFRYCFFRVRTRTEAEEIVQETFMKTWKYMASGAEIENIRAFLYRVAANSIVDSGRKKREESLDELLSDVHRPEPSYEEKKDIEDAILMKDIRAELSALPEEDRDIILLRFMDDLSPKEIAVALEISANNASVRLNRAVKRLKQHLKEKKKL